MERSHSNASFAKKEILVLFKNGTQHLSNSTFLFLTLYSELIRSECLLQFSYRAHSPQLNTNMNIIIAEFSDKGNCRRHQVLCSKSTAENTDKKLEPSMGKEHPEESNYVGLSAKRATYLWRMVEQSQI